MESDSLIHPIGLTTFQRYWKNLFHKSKSQGIKLICAMFAISSLWIDAKKGN